MTTLTLTGIGVRTPWVACGLRHGSTLCAPMLTPTGKSRVSRPSWRVHPGAGSRGHGVGFGGWTAVRGALVDARAPDERDGGGQLLGGPPRSRPQRLAGRP